MASRYATGCREQAIDDGIAYITEDRKLNGFFETMVVDDNVYIGKLVAAARLALLSVGSEMQAARRPMDQAR